MQTQSGVVTITTGLCGGVGLLTFLHIHVRLAGTYCGDADIFSSPPLNMDTQKHEFWKKCPCLCYSDLMLHFGPEVQSFEKNYS